MASPDTSGGRVPAIPPASRRGTLISWTDETWNPVTGCTAASAGCDHCYARTLINKWFAANVKAAVAAGFTRPRDGLTVVELARKAGVRLPYSALQAARPFSSVQCWPSRLTEPGKWREPRRVFVNSLSDVFHPDVPDEFRDQMFAVMEQNPRHVFQILTKRPDIMARYVRERYARPRLFDGLDPEGAMAPEHIWLGTSIEDARVLAPRLAELSRVPAPIKFVSAEPLIGPWTDGSDSEWLELAAFLRVAGVAWVIVGGESGPGYRPMDQAWAREIRDACIGPEGEPIAFFFKQDAAFRTEMRCYLVEEDGSRWEWHQWPGMMAEPKRLDRGADEHAHRAGG